MNLSQEALYPRPESAGPESRGTGYRDFAIIVALLAALRMALPFIPFPNAILPFLNFLLLIGVFLGTIFAIYRAMSEKPNPQLAILILLVGVFLQVAAISLANNIFGGKGFTSILFLAIAQTGLMIWCIGLGALISSLLREKNILIPVAIFLVGFDIFLVLTPVGVTQKLMKSHPGLLQQAGMAIPRATSQHHNVSNASPATAALVGPADLVFLGAFFLAMYRFGMRPKETMKIMIPVLIGYMILVLATGWALPALVPIGLVTLLVNRREFNLSKDEKASTIVLTLLVIGGLIFSATRKPAPPTEPLPSEPSATSSAPAGLPAPTSANQPQSSGQNAPQSTPNPQ